jgi:hypothetical protein
MIRAVRASARRLIAITLLSVSIGAPMLEMGDRWDNTARDGNDTECNLVIAALCAGVAFVAARFVLRTVRLSAAHTLVRVRIVQFITSTAESTVSPLPHPSPPLLLRI